MPYCLMAEEAAPLLANVNDVTVSAQYMADEEMAAKGNNIFAASYLGYSRAEGWNEITNLPAEARTECQPGLVPPSVESCVDTREARSVATVATAIDEAKLNLYSKFGGSGEVVGTIEYKEEAFVPGFSGQWLATRHLIKGWSKNMA